MSALQITEQEDLKMSNPLQDKIQSMISSSVRMSKSTLMTEIISYNHDARTIDVRALGQDRGISISSDTQSAASIKGITVMNSRVIKDEGLEPGDFAYIDFVDSTFTTAVVLNVIKRNIYEDTDRSGATLLKPLSSQAPPVWAKGGE